MSLPNDLWVVIPAHNEEKNISNLLQEIKKYTKNIIVVDDGSKDNTAQKAKNQNVETISHLVNLGKGAALKTGCDLALKKNAKKIIVIDGDAQHNPKEIPKFAEKLKNSDIVFGFRKKTKAMPLVLMFGNWFINQTIKLLYQININDSQCGYRAFTSEAYKKIRWQASDYSMESEMISNTGKNKLKYTELEIENIYSDKYKGTTIIDGIKIVLNMVLWKIFKR